MSGPIDRLPAQRPRAILEGLEGLAARARRGENIQVPLITLYLRGAHVITGRFIAYQHDPREGTVAVHTSQTHGANDVAYVPLDSVSALVVHHVPDTMPLLSGGKIAPKPAEIPGKLVLDRQAANLSERFGPIELDWLSLDNTDESRGAVALTLDGMSSILETLFADDMGRSSWKEKIERVRIAIGDDIKIEARVLRLGLVQKNGEVFALAPSELKHAIEALL